MKSKHLVNIADLPREDVEEILRTAHKMKADHKKGKKDLCLAGKTLGMIFEKPSLRTRVSFEVGMSQLGGQTIYLSKDDIKIGKRESPIDVARVISRYLDGLMMRTFSHEIIVIFAEHATVPIINGLSDYVHPCQALGDLFTIQEQKGDLSAIKAAFVGDGNNVARSLAFACAKLGVSLALSSPKGHELDEQTMKIAEDITEREGCVRLVGDPQAAVRGADVVYTDVWASMGQEDEAKKREQVFRRYRVDAKLMSKAKKDAIFMHCLPAHRGEEVTDEVLDSPQSVVLDQAENRMHVQKAILKLLMS
ncbi:MAG: ornithine carbamoyltransferase [Planctomycetota bacterium]